MDFKSRYDATKKIPSVMDSHDCVDRLSYVDSTKMVQRMIQEGHNLMAYRAAALTRGRYSIYDLNEDETLPAVGVYPEDPAITGAKLEAYKEEANARKAKASSVVSDLDPKENNTSEVKTDTNKDD